MKPKPNKEVRIGREFWLAYKDNNFVVTFAYPSEEYYNESCAKFGAEKIHVIEYSAYQDLQERVEGLEAMLAKYEKAEDSLTDHEKETLNLFLEHMRNDPIGKNLK